MGAHQPITINEAIPQGQGVTTYSLIESLCSAYAGELAKIQKVCDLFADPDVSSAMFYFNEAQRRAGIVSSSFGAGSFGYEGARNFLKSSYWRKALDLTDVLEIMPAKRAQELTAQMNSDDCPDFDLETVRSTIGSLLSDRSKYFAEKVDGIFQSLSRSHVTNSPMGFRARMILSGMFCQYGFVEIKADVISDLRCVIAKMSNRGEPSRYLTRQALAHAYEYHRGEWRELDGGAIRVRCYKVGTVHVEIHPEFAWRLNEVLALLYPAAIPEKFRTATKQQKKQREYTLMENRLPFAVLNILADVRPTCRDNVWSVHTYLFSDADKHLLKATGDVLKTIGGVNAGSPSHFRFDYNPVEVIREIVDSGAILDIYSHQFYPTPERLSEIAAELLHVESGDVCYEPSAGQGALAEHLPKDTTTCIEVNSLQCEILRNKGYEVVNADFLTWAMSAPKADKILMNPPFSQGRAIAHLEAAGKLLKRGGRIVAILPASMMGKDYLEGFALSWHGPFNNEFDGTGISVGILVAERPE
ncbi:DUF4942 domain-containing protein (plasmid) [Halopseudomonas sp. SMJS2]|uniref:class I SAM-dependent methyltransferase n=1 Tax=Halopseudomonas sp. SMJS2 TaxID=3041098 RepID=UPI002452ADBE|nr:class I SAM-dependent methyltransferase [Halopseudomonas sp. SMJS2]WGK63426.1 DUF4942 domain-containing protein [Halopseudomonas sp. SMJS2]